MLAVTIVYGFFEQVRSYNSHENDIFLLSSTFFMIYVIRWLRFVWIIIALQYLLLTIFIITNRNMVAQMDPQQYVTKLNSECKYLTNGWFLLA